LSTSRKDSTVRSTWALMAFPQNIDTSAVEYCGIYTVFNLTSDHLLGERLVCCEPHRSKRSVAWNRPQSSRGFENNNTQSKISIKLFKSCQARDSTLENRNTWTPGTLLPEQENQI
jgi:hypothetical protein